MIKKATTGVVTIASAIEPHTPKTVSFPKFPMAQTKRTPIIIAMKVIMFSKFMFEYKHKLIFHAQTLPFFCGTERMGQRVRIPEELLPFGPKPDRREKPLSIFCYGALE